MVEHLHNPHLAKEFLATGGTELGLVNNFNGNLLARYHMASQFDLGKVALPNSTDEFVLPDMGLITAPDGGNLWRDTGSARGSGGPVIIGVAGDATGIGTRMT